MSNIIQEVSNWLLGSFKVRVTRLTDRSVLQHTRIDKGSGQTESVVTDANPFPVFLAASSSGGEGLPTAAPTYSQVACNNATSAEILAENSSRKRGSHLYNNTASTFWVKEGSVAVSGEGDPVFPGAVYSILSTKSVNGILASGGPSSINAIEVT